MNKTHLEWRVGLFVLIGLVLVGALLLQFSKGLTIFRSTYEINLHAENVGGLKPSAAVLMSGVQVGTVGDIKLAPDGKSVIIPLTVYSRFVIYKDAVFSIEQSGFLGDQYVAIRPTDNSEGPFKNGDYAEARKPFDLQEFIGSSGEFLQQVEQAVLKLDQALSNLNTYVLSPQTLTNLSATADNLRQVSGRAVVTLDRVNALIETNSPALTLTFSNLATFSSQLKDIGGDVNALVASNAPSFDRAVKNVESSTEILKSVLADVQAGKGPVGNLLQNEELAADMNELAHNLKITSSNLNTRGLWGILWKQKTPRTNEPPSAPEQLLAPKDPFQ